MASSVPGTNPPPPPHPSASVTCAYLLVFLFSDSHPDSLDPSHTGFLFFSYFWNMAVFLPIGALVLQFLPSGIQFHPVQFSHLVMSDSAIPWTAARQASLSITNSRSLLNQTHVHRVGDAIQPSHLLLSPSPPAFNLSQHQGLFKWVSSSHQVAKYWSFSFSISPSSEYSGLISFMMDWLDLLAVQGTLKSLLQ